MAILDAKLDENWSTILASPFGGGFRGLFLLDITDPEASHGNLFRWEVNSETLQGGEPVFSRMGYILNAPKVVRFQIPDGAGQGFHEKWVLIVGNGVHSQDYTDTKDPGGSDPGYTNVMGKASVFFIDLDSGELITEILLDNGYVDQNLSKEPAYNHLNDANGVTSVAAVDSDQNTFIDYVYGADLKGNIWRINYEYNAGDDPNDDIAYLKSKLVSAFTSNGKPQSIFTAEGPESSLDADTVVQPITAELTVTTAPASGGINVGETLYFGTGQYFDTAHIRGNTSENIQTMYAIWDKGQWDSASSPDEIDKSDDLVEQTLTEIGNDRVISNTSINYSGGELGWYIDLPAYGERIIRKPIGVFDDVTFFSQVPSSTDSCEPGSNGWQMDVSRDNASPAFLGASIGVKQVGEVFHDPVYVQLSDGTIVSPVIDITGDIRSPVIVSETRIPVEFLRTSWRKLLY
jgi:type IV pilus assembly protein PilY1